MTVFDQISMENLLSFAGFVGFLIWLLASEKKESARKNEMIAKKEAEKSEIQNRRIEDLRQQNSDYLEFIRRVDHIAQLQREHVSAQLQPERGP